MKFNNVTKDALNKFKTVFAQVEEFSENNLRNYQKIAQNRL